MKPLHHTRSILSAMASVTVLTLALTVPAQATATGWTVVFTHHYGPASSYSGFTAVAVPGPGDAWAFGSTDLSGATPGTPVAEHWNGTNWSSSPLPAGLSSTIAAASVVSASSVWAVTEYGGDILHWNGSTWSVDHHVPGSGLLFSGITAISDSDVWAFGSSGFGPGLGTWHFDGHTWTHITTGLGAGVNSASAVSASDIWGIGTSRSGPTGDILVHYDGTTWTRVTATTLNGLLFPGILALSKSDVWVIAGNHLGGHEQLVHFDGSQWTSVPSPYTTRLSKFAPDGQGGFWMNGSNNLGTKEWLLHVSATSLWSRATLTSGSMDPIALVPGTTSLWGAGSVLTGTTGSAARIWAYGQGG